jgi:anhydro-N-acetylmuramic acid kinase
MSGTSADGIDAAVVEISGHGYGTRARLLAFRTTAYDDALRRRLLAAERATAAELCVLDVELGEAFAAATSHVIAAAGLHPGEVHLVGSHGQTAVHLPPSLLSSISALRPSIAAIPNVARGGTLQIGQGAVIAERTGLPVICNFRVRDIAAGGEGAPLVPLADALLLSTPDRVRALQNIGGIANITVLAPATADHANAEPRILAFDNGPGNMALDLVVQAASRGSARYDEAGEWAARGHVDAPLLAELLRHPFLSVPPPRSSGRELFGHALVDPLLKRFRGREDDLLATLTRFTAEAIRSSVASHVEPRIKATIDELYVSGGGVYNDTLMHHLRELFAPTKVESTAALGIDPDAKEAIAFAVLANETLHGQPGNVPSATGARGPRVLGTIVL